MAAAEKRSPLAADVQRRRFEQCFKDHYAAILSFALRRVAETDTAEDVAAETFAVAWRRRDQLPDPPLPWLYETAFRVIANHHRSGRRRRDLDDRAASEAAVAAGSADFAEALGRKQAFAAAFSELSEADREILRLVAWDGLEVNDAARLLGCSAPAFRVRLHRARRRLRKQLEVSGHRQPEKAPPKSTEPTEEARG